MLIGVTSTPTLCNSTKNVIRYFVDELNVRHIAIGRSPLDLHTILLQHPSSKKENYMFDGIIASNITNNEEAELIRRKGGLVLHLENQNSLFEIPVSKLDDDLIISVSPSSPPTRLTLDGFIAAINEHFAINKETEAA